MSSQEITMEGLTASYEPHELRIMRSLTQLAEHAEGEKRTGILNEIRFLHKMKAQFLGSQLEDALEELRNGPINLGGEASERFRNVVAAGPPPPIAPPAEQVDHGLFARATDPVNSHRASEEIEQREGTTAKLTYGSQKHRILEVYGRFGRPLTDTGAWNGAGIGPRSGAWHRCSDLLDAGAISHATDMIDPETNKVVRGCVITEHGRAALQRLLAGEKQVTIGS